MLISNIINFIAPLVLIWIFVYAANNENGFEKPISEAIKRLFLNLFGFLFLLFMMIFTTLLFDFLGLGKAIYDKGFYFYKQ